MSLGVNGLGAGWSVTFMKVPVKLEVQGNVCVFGGGRSFGKWYWPRPQNDSALTQQAHDPQLPHVWTGRHVHVVLRAVGQHRFIKGQRKHAVNNFQIRLPAGGKPIPERGLRLSPDFLLQVDFDLFTVVSLLVLQQRIRTTATTYESTCSKWPLELGNNRVDLSKRG